MLRALGLSPSEPDGYADLSDTQRELVSMLVSGFTGKAIAARQGWTDRTVRRWTHELMERLDAQTRFQAGYQSVVRGWVTAGAEDSHATP